MNIEDPRQQDAGGVAESSTRLYRDSLLRDERVPFYRDFLGKLRERRGLTYRDLALAMKTPPDLVEMRIKQLQRFFLESENPSAGFALAVMRAIDPQLTLTPEDWGFNPEGPA